MAIGPGTMIPTTMADNKIIPEGMEECEACSGKGKASWSCCTQERVDEDYSRCPTCGEGLGEEQCQECNGLGYVPVGTPNEPVHIVDPIGAAEAHFEGER